MSEPKELNPMEALFLEICRSLGVVWLVERLTVLLHRIADRGKP